MLRVLHQSAQCAIVALVPRCHFASKTCNSDNKIRSRKLRRKQQFHEVRAAGLRVNPWFLSSLGTEVLREVGCSCRGERLLARLFQVPCNGIKEKLSHLYLAGGQDAALAQIMMRTQKLREFRRLIKIDPRFEGLSQLLLM